jgi:cytochrome b561
MTIADHHNLSLIPTCNVSSDANVVAIVFHWSHVTEFEHLAFVGAIRQERPKGQRFHGSAWCIHKPLQIRVCTYTLNKLHDGYLEETK